jgi:predicted permease
VAPNIRLALRGLFKTPFVTTVAVVSLALGIGANTAIFSLFDQLLLRPLPVPEPARLVNLSAPGPRPGNNSSDKAGPTEAVFSYPMFRDLERLQTAFTGLAAHRRFGANLSYRGQTLSGEGMLVSGSYFSVLGLRPAQGRLFGPDDDRTPGAHALVVLSHDYWRTRFEESAAVLDQTLIVNGQALTIVGVTPPGFHGTTLGSRPEVFVPLSMRAAMVPGWNDFENRRAYWAYLFARLQPDVSLEGAQAAINVPYRAILNEVEVPLQHGLSDQTLARFKGKEIVLSEGARGQSRLHRGARAPLLLLLAVTAFVLLIACANIANLLLARGAGRAGEMAVRLSIGASRGQLIRQLLTESSVLAGLGGLLGLLVAHWTLILILALLPAQAAAILRAELAPTVLLFVAALALGTGLLFGLFPALESSRPDLVAGLKGHSGQSSGSRVAARLRTSLATAQIALSMALLVSAGLFTRSLAKVTRIDLGLDTNEIVTFAVSPELNRYTPLQSRALFERIEDELGAVPGVTGVAASMVPLISGSNWSNGVSVEGFEAGPDADTDSAFNRVGPGFFRTLGVPLLAGRDFTRADAAGAPKVAIVNEAFTRKFNLGRGAVGKRMRAGLGGKLDIEIIGLVRDAKYSEVKDAVPPQYFEPYRQDEGIGSINFYVRSSLGPEQVFPAVTRRIARLDANLPVEDLRTMNAQVRDNVFIDRMINTLSAAFASLATSLAAVGLYGVLAYTVARRTREIGVRMALGADGRRVRRMVLGEVARMILAGGAIGVAAALGLGRLARSLLFELEGHDPAVLAVSAALLTAIAFGAGYLPALRASRIDPMRALHHE